ncbi:hypothetical protein OPV22_014308 [Ensete ventricosum]|uniref:DUF676 domain-containing protein n=1 Tax=Ensete ventricosum TaxID=4639 RepID=A0AAV8R7Q4_ENSVE|nr:hypothetical protein OPV22_014308 [Ensete ventricosum]
MAQGESAPEDDGQRSSTRQWRRYTSYLRRPSCLNPAADGPTGMGSDRSAAAAVRDSGSAAEQRAPTHLVVMVNGIIGSAANWKYAAKQFVKSHPEGVVVHRSECNYSTLTFDGVDVMGERLADEVISIVANNPGLQKISFVGHSLGGLIARYAISLLYEKSIQKHSSEENGECEDHTLGTTCVDKNFKGKIAGLEPINFITFATPHLGSRLHKQIPILRGFYTLEKMACHTCWILGRTGKHLFLKDKDNGKPPLLVQMVNDYGDLRFMSALQSFKRRVAYSNVCFDFIVGRKTSSIRHQHELPKRQDFMKNSKYRHIVYVEKPIITDVPQMNFSASTTCELNTISEMEEVMINGLNRVPWERVDVSFRKCSQRFFAHSTIQVKTYLINSHGADVIFHMIDNFLL